MNGGDRKSAFAFIVSPQRCSRPQGPAEQGARHLRCVHRGVLPVAVYPDCTTAVPIRLDRSGASPQPQGPMPPHAPILATHPQRIPGSPPSRAELVGTRVRRAGGGAFRC